MQGYKLQRPMAVGIKEYIWRKGEERCERSAREPGAREPEPVPEPETANTKTEKPIAIQPMSLTPDGFRQVSTKREEANTKMSERYLVGQATQNPFMPSNNYVNDIEVQMNFLTPQKS